MDDLTDFKNLLAAKKLVFGKEETVKKLRQGKITKVYLSSNCDQMTKRDFHNLCFLNNTPCVDLTQTNEEIGVICKKPYTISVVGAA